MAVPAARLRERGVDPERINRVVDGTMADHLDALRNGEVDVAQLFEPYVSLALRAGAGEILYAASKRGPTTYTTFVTTRDSISKHRIAFAAMVRATQRTLAWAAEHSAEQLAEAVAGFYPDVAHAILKSALHRYRHAGLWARTPDVSRQGFARLAESLKSGGYVSRVYSYDDCVELAL
jgi:NitT/TauT family transport system substrate-binding protein